MDPLLTLITHQPFVEVANIIRTGAAEITLRWDAAVREAMPQMQCLTFEELQDSTPQILLAIAHALASDNPNMIRELASYAPAQGLSRFRLHFDVVEVMQEDRLLRAITVQYVETHLGRRMEIAESTALHGAIDVMLQRSVIALVEQQKSQLRAAAETELKFLSYLSHDLNNNLSGVTLSLGALEQDLSEAGGFTEAEKSLRFAQKSIHDTIAGMRRMLDHERLRKSQNVSASAPVDLYAAAMKVAAQFAREAQARATQLCVDVQPGAMLESDADLLALVLQNLVGNGLKYGRGGAVHVGFDGGNNLDRPVLWVSDEGPGIAPEQMKNIFEAFQRGDVHGEPGVGLGLAIASQAAKLLGATLTVKSDVGQGSTFHLALPANSYVHNRMLLEA
jgi:signal transduction histidine kinase